MICVRLAYISKSQYMRTNNDTRRNTQQCIVKIKTRRISNKKNHDTRSRFATTKWDPVSLYIFFILLNYTSAIERFTFLFLLAKFGRED